MRLKLDGLFALQDSAGLSLQELQAESNKIPEFLERFRARSQGFHELPKWKGYVLAVKQLVEKLRPRFERGEWKDIVVLGIGGSALGITCLRDALKGPLWN